MQLLRYLLVIEWVINEWLTGSRTPCGVNLQMQISASVDVLSSWNCQSIGLLFTENKSCELPARPRRIPVASLCCCSRWFKPGRSETCILNSYKPNSDAVFYNTNIPNSVKCIADSHRLCGDDDYYRQWQTGKCLHKHVFDTFVFCQVYIYLLLMTRPGKQKKLHSATFWMDSFHIVIYLGTWSLIHSLWFK